MDKAEEKADMFGGKVNQSKRDRLEHWKGIFKQPGVWKKLEYLFWRTLCTYPDQTRIGMWWYGISGRIAAYFHSKTCDRCNERYRYGWWAKYGHWCHVSFWRAMDHLIRGGKVRFGRW